MEKTKRQARQPRGRNTGPTRKWKFKLNPLAEKHLIGPLPPQLGGSPRPHVPIPGPPFNAKFAKRLKFYRTVFGFNPPFLILMDESFGYSLLANKIGGSVDSYFKDRFEGKCYLILTSCSLRSILTTSENKINTDMKELFGKIQLHYCTRGDNHDAFECIKKIIEESNQFGTVPPKGPRGGKYRPDSLVSPFIFASQRAKQVCFFQSKVGVPVIYFNKDQLSIDVISDSSRQWEREVTRKKLEALSVTRKVLAPATTSNEIAAEEKTIKADENDGDKLLVQQPSGHGEELPAEFNSKRVRKRRPPSPDMGDVGELKKQNIISKISQTACSNLSNQVALVDEMIINFDYFKSLVGSAYQVSKAPKPRVRRRRDAKTEEIMILVSSDSLDSSWPSSSSINLEPNIG